MEKVLLFNKGVMFSLEICAIVSLAYWGFHSQPLPPLSYLFGIGTPLLAAVIWNYFAAPLSTHRLSMPYRGIFAIVVFWIAAILLYQSGARIYAILFAIFSLISVIIASFLET